MLISPPYGQWWSTANVRWTGTCDRSRGVRAQNLWVLYARTTKKVTTKQVTKHAGNNNTQVTTNAGNNNTQVTTNTGNNKRR